jgi:peptide/nickel transport system permease protein
MLAVLIFVARRLALLIVTLLAVSVLIFSVTQVLPGDVATMALGTSATPEDLATLRGQLGLDRPAITQYADWLGGILRGDLGTSTRFRMPVAPILFDRLVNSAWLSAVGLFFAIPLGIGLGTLTGLRPNKPMDHIVSTGMLFVAAMPEFVTGAFLILVFSTWLGWFPPFSAIEGGMTLPQIVLRLILPALSLSFVIMAYMLRMTRATMIETMASPYIRAAVLRGLPNSAIVVRHALPNVAGPTVAVIALSIGWLAGGLVIVENMFGYPGLGRLLVFAVQNRDIPVIQASSLVMAAAYAIANLCDDLLQRLINPGVGNA